MPCTNETPDSPQPLALAMRHAAPRPDWTKANTLKLAQERARKTAEASLQEIIKEAVKEFALGKNLFVVK